MLSRRDFLKRTALSAFSWPFIKASYYSCHLQPDRKYTSSTILGRILFDNTPSHTSPDAKSPENGIYQHNDVIALSQPISGYSKLSNNNIWYRIASNTFIHSYNIQLVQKSINKPVENIISTGQLAEITVPYTEAWPRDKQDSTHQLFFYGSNHWVYGLVENPQGNQFYIVKEDRWNNSYYVNALHMRIFDDEDLQPISSYLERERKSILVDTRNQILTAYEDDLPVLVSSISTGKSKTDVNLSTPVGEYTINYKRPSRHMVHSDKIGINDSELYGVPWVSYFTDTGIAFHGTYWHNNYSLPRSHGCVNMPISTARWLYLWVDPVVPPREKKYVSKYGTRVTVI